MRPKKYRRATKPWVDVSLLPCKNFLSQKNNIMATAVLRGELSKTFLNQFSSCIVMLIIFWPWTHLYGTKLNAKKNNFFAHE